MSKKCFVCKKEPGPENSLHKFPSNNIMKEKWITALGLPKTPFFKTTLICGNHFKPKDFFPNTGNRQRPRLLPNAVPSWSPLTPAPVNQKSMIILHPIVFIKKEAPTPFDNSKTGAAIKESKPDLSLKKSDLDISFEEREHYVPGISESIPSEYIVPDPLANVNIKQESLEGNSDEDISNLSENSYVEESSDCKRISQSEEVPSNKQIRLTDGVQTELFSRKDFSSDVAWDRFYRIIQAIRHNQAITQQKRMRNRRKWLRGSKRTEI